MLFFLLPVQGSVKRRYPFPEGSSFLVTPLGNRALASSSESEGMTMTFSPGWDRHRNRGVLSIGRRAKRGPLSATCGFCCSVPYLRIKMNYMTVFVLRFDRL